MARYIQHDLMKNLKQVVNLRIILMLFFLIVMKINISFFSFLNLEINKINLQKKLVLKYCWQKLPQGHCHLARIKEQKHHKNLPWCMVARYGCVQKNCRNNMLTARVSSLTDRFILWLEATYEPEFWFSFFLNGGGAK